MRQALRFAPLLAVLAAPLHAATGDDGASAALQDALVTVQADIRRDTEALNALRARVEEERRPLAEKLESLRDTVSQRRKEVERIRRLRSQGEKEQAALVARADALEEELTFLRSLFVEYARAMDTRMNAARHPGVMERLQSARAALDNRKAPFAEGADALLNLAADWNGDRFGGMSFPGAALDDNGLEHPGRFATFGPAAYFAADDKGGPTGLAVLRFGADRPAVYEDLARETRSAIRDLVSGGRGVVPVDASGGDAIRVAEAQPSLAAHLKQGGLTMIPLAAVALAAVLLSIWKLVELGRMRVSADEHVRGVLIALRSGDTKGARKHADAVRKPLRLLIDDLIEHKDAPRDHLEEIMHEHVLASLPFVERNLGALAVLGGIAPLLGLLGTVTGMIHTFQLVTLFGSGDAKLLSSGISEALVTTETGLAIAIPTLLVHAYLSRRARGLIGSLETMAATLVNDLKLRKTS